QDANTTEVDFVEQPGGWPAYSLPGVPRSAASDFSVKTPLSEQVVKEIIGKEWESESLAALAAVQGWSPSDLAANIAKQALPRTKKQAGVFVFRQRAAIFGYNAPNYDLLLASLKLPPPASGVPVIFEAPLPEFGFAGGSGFTGTTGLVGFGGF